jgi:hypothetical protein
MKSPSHKGKIVAKHSLPSDGRSRPLKHLGGFQLVGDYAVTGVEDDRGKKRSQIWDAELAIKSGWCDGNWENYQNLNFLTYTDDCVYLTGLHRERGHNYADLFEVAHRGVDTTVRKVPSKHLILRNKHTFQHAGGV